MGDISTEKNFIYGMIRECFAALGFDDEHYGTADWNPLSEYVNEGDTVLLKPNWVLHENAEPISHSMECMVTHPSITRAVIDYVLIALNGTGKITVADAPVQGCDFDILQTSMHYNELWEYYEKQNIHIEVLDMRGRIVHSKPSGAFEFIKNEDDGICVKLNEQSCFSFCSSKRLDGLRITRYPTDILKQHHDLQKHEYSIHKSVLEADVIINLAKPKSHRKAGMTACLKNMVGTCVRKEYLPHHTTGSLQEGGDEYLHKSDMLKMSSNFLDRYNDLEKDHTNVAAVNKFFSKATRVIGQTANKEQFWEGSWYGNDTIWRTIVDLNRIIRFADKNGIIQDIAQRKMLCITDMIVTGEKEGPMEPSPKKLGLILAGSNPVTVDYTICTIFGFDPGKVKYLPYMMKEQMLSELKIEIHYGRGMISPYGAFNFSPDWRIEPTSGWKGHIEKE